MITASFRHIAGVGPLRERQLWQMGIHHWDQLPAGEILAPRLDDRLRRGVAESRSRWAAGDLAHFGRALPAGEHWRMLPHVLDGAGFLDIETTGAGDGEVTVVGILDRDGPNVFLRGRDLAAFPARTRAWSCLVTFNGANFDLPILRRAFPAWVPPPLHVDLRQVFQRLGERGGLKTLEPRCGLFRPPHLARLAGADAVGLWHAQRRGDPAALRRLVEYNLYDVFHLKPLAEIGYNRLLLRTGMPAAQLLQTDRGAMLYDVSNALERACTPPSPLAALAAKDRAC